MGPVRFAFIGCGRIAHFHADVIKHLGHSIDVVVAREDSLNLDSFSKKYAVREKIYSIGSFLDYYKNHKDSVDCILVCTPWNVTGDILKELMSLDLPIMTEKPAVLSMDMLNQLKQKRNINNLFIAYNRRFYDFVPFVNDLVDKERPVCVDILSADPYEMIVKKEGKEIGKYILYYYTSHIIDLMFYIFKDVKIKDIVKFGANDKNSWVCSLYIEKYRCPTQVKILMDCPQNSSFKIFFENKAIVMEPFERMALYDGLRKQVNNGNAIYLPSIKTEIETDRVFKPGFLNQMKYFIEKFVYNNNSSGEYIEQLEKVTSFCDTMAQLKNEV